MSLKHKKRYKIGRVFLSGEESWGVIIEKNDSYVDIMGGFKTKLQALKFAKQYMRTH